jgi:hypothetical protein
MTDKIQEYTGRHRVWADISVTQLSTTNNLLLTISAGLLAFCFDKDTFRQIHIKFSESINWTQFFYISSIVVLAFSITFGICVLVTRLYDFRISRHLALTRKRVYAKSSKPLPDNDLGGYSAGGRVKALFNVLFCRLPFISKIAVDNFEPGGQLTTDFNSLRRLSKVLGSASWRWTKIQLILFFVSVVFYMLHFFF